MKSKERTQDYNASRFCFTQLILIKYLTRYLPKVGAIFEDGDGHPAEMHFRNGTFGGVYWFYFWFYYYFKKRALTDMSLRGLLKSVKLLNTPLLGAEVQTSLAYYL